MNASYDIRIERLEHVVEGNGSPGLKTQVAVLQKDVGELGDIKSRITRLEKSVWTAGGIILGIELLMKFTH
jgi:hypothetical protein